MTHTLRTLNVFKDLSQSAVSSLPDVLDRRDRLSYMWHMLDSLTTPSFRVQKRVQAMVLVTVNPKHIESTIKLKIA